MTLIQWLAATLTCVCGAAAEFYTTKQLTPSFGAAIDDFSFPSAIDDPSFIDQLKRDVEHHRLLWFRKPSLQSGELVKLAAALGSVWERPDFYPTRPHESITRHSNDARHGHTHTTCAPQQQRSRPWHVEGLSMHSPFRYMVLQGIKQGRAGSGTMFLPLKELVEAQPPRVRHAWEGLWMESRSGALHPLVYKHPATSEPTMALYTHENLVSSFVQPSTELRMSGERVFVELNAAIEELGMQLAIEWSAGDVLIVDNVAVAHRAPDDDDSELRILDRIDVYDDGMSATALLAHARADKMTKQLFGVDLLIDNMKLFYNFYSHGGDPCSCLIAVPVPDIICPPGMSCITVGNESMKGMLTPTTNQTIIDHCCISENISHAQKLRR